MNLSWVYDLPSGMFAGLVIVACVAVSVGGLLMTRRAAVRLMGPAPGQNDLVGDILQAAGVFYGITLGLITVGAWTSYSEVEETVSREAAALGALFRDAECLPEPARSDLRGTLKEYTKQTIEVAWPAQRKGVTPSGGMKYMEGFQARLVRFKPADAGEQVVMQGLFEQYNTMTELRRLRLDRVTAGMPAVMWIVVIAGAMVNLVLLWCLVMEKTRVHVLLVVLLATLVALLIFLTAALDRPFRGQVGVGSEAFELIYEQVMGGDAALH